MDFVLSTQSLDLKSSDGWGCVLGTGEFERGLACVVGLSLKALKSDRATGFESVAHFLHSVLLGLLGHQF